MIIAIDYDNTFTLFPKQFTELRESFQKDGHKVFIVTARNKDLEPIPFKDTNGFDKVFYTDGKAKATVVRADIWIDDSPVTLCCDFVPGAAHASPSKAKQFIKDIKILTYYGIGKKTNLLVILLKTLSLKEQKKSSLKDYSYTY